MIELKSIKSYNARDSKFNQAKSQVMFDKSKSIKFTSSCTCNDLSDNRLVIYLGLTNGSIVAITLYKKDASQTLNEYDDNFKLLSCYDQFKHKGPISVLIAETIDLTPVLFSGGADGSIKLWLGDPDLRENLIEQIYSYIEPIRKKAQNYIKNIADDVINSVTLLELTENYKVLAKKLDKLKDEVDLEYQFEDVELTRIKSLKIN